MKISLVVHDLHDRGGHSRYTRILADELARRHDVTVFANVCERSPAARWDFKPVRAWRVNALATVQTFPLGLRSLSNSLADFDIRHMQGYCGGRPNVVTAHICLAAYRESLRGISRRTQASLGMMAAAESRFYQRYDGQVIAISEKIARELRDFYHVTGPISVIPHGVDAERFRGDENAPERRSLRGELGIAPEALLALYVGDLTKAHTQLKTVAAAAPEVEFVIVTSSSQYRWVAPNVHFVSATPALAFYYRAADAFVFPTTYDAFGLVLLEAMAAGLAVFTSDRAGAAELITSGKDGFEIPLADWVEATIAGLRDRESLRRVGREARRTAQQHDWSKVVAAVEQVYLNVTTVADSAVSGNAITGNGYRYQA